MFESESRMTGSLGKLFWFHLAASFAVFCVAAALWWPAQICAQSAGTTAAAPQQPSPPSAGADQEPHPDASPEMATHDSPIPLQVRVNLVPVRVIVRDSMGHPVPNLRKEDFRLLEDGKPQAITKFSVMTPSNANAELATTAPVGTEPAPAAPPFRPAARFVALVFDDINLKFGDLVQSRKAAERFIDASLQPADRAAVLTLSGQTETDFTDDRARLRETLELVQPRSVSAGPASNEDRCPTMSYLEADRIHNQQDPQAIQVATSDALACAFGGNVRMLTAAQALARSTAMQIVAAGDTQAEYAVRRLREIVRRLTALAGQRTMILVSPGLLILRHENDVSDIVDRAVRANVVVSTLDARGLYTNNLGPDISQDYAGDPTMAAIHASNDLEASTRQADVMIELAYGTAGYYFHNSNDLDAGFRAVGGQPEVSYLLGFAPETTKYDGKFHSIKVNLLTKEKYVVQARGGFYAPKRSEDPADLAKQEIEEAVLSQEVQRGMPIELHTQFYKVNPTEAKLAVMAHVDIGRMRFQKTDGRNRNQLTVVAALFDRNGNYVTGTQKVLEMRLRDATLEKLEHTGLTVKSSFDVKAGGYFVRLVVREANAALLSTQNGVVDIPY